MYELLAAGLLGNTLPQYFTFASFYDDPATVKYREWGLRSFVPGGPSAMYLQWHEAAEVAHALERAGTPFNLSPMLGNVTLMANVCVTPGVGLYVHYVEYPPERTSWRVLFARPDTSLHASGVAAYNLLKRHLNANALDDVTELLQRYDGHVVEISATGHCVGLLPHRNYVTWEVRNY